MRSISEKSSGTRQEILMYIIETTKTDAGTRKIPITEDVAYYMSLEKKLGETALDLVKNENVQNKVADLLGMLFPYVAIKKKAVDLYIEVIENSDLSAGAKVISLLNAKKTLM